MLCFVFNGISVKALTVPFLNAVKDVGNWNKSATPSMAGNKFRFAASLNKRRSLECSISGSMRACDSRFEKRWLMVSENLSISSWKE